MGKVPCEFWADQPRFSFQGNLSQRAFQPSPAKDGASLMASGSSMIWHIYSCLACSTEDGARGRSPMSFEQIGPLCLYTTNTLDTL